MAAPQHCFSYTFGSVIYEKDRSLIEGCELIYIYSELTTIQYFVTAI